MDDSYCFTTAEQQIKKLKSQKLTFQNEQMAVQCLNTYGYYNIINGYRDPYITREYDRKVYSPDVSFEQIFALFCLDHQIRDAIMSSMIDLEEHLRSVTANIIGEFFGIDHRIYLNKNNYRDKNVKDLKFSRDSILGKLEELANSSMKEPLKYYREKYEKIPPWILLKGTYFGTLMNYIRLFKGPQKDKMVEIIYGSQVKKDNITEFKDLLSDTLFVCLEYRNLATHGGRVYNYTPKSSIRRFSNLTIKGGLPELLNALHYMYYKQPYLRLRDNINYALNKYCSSYPNDVARITQATGLEISENIYVWVNEKSGIFHTTQFCSGAQSCKRVTLENALQDKYVPCKKCCPENGQI